MQSKINIAQSTGGTQEMYNVVQQANAKFSSKGFYQRIEEADEIQD